MCVPSPKRLVDSTGPTEIAPPSTTGEENSSAPALPSSPNSDYAAATSHHPISSSQLQIDPASTHHLLQMRDYDHSNKKKCGGLESDFHRKTKVGKLRDAKSKVLSCLRRNFGLILTGAVFVLFFNVIGWMGCYSVLFVSLQDEFHSSATETGWVGSLAYIINCLCTPVSDMLLRRFSNRAICVAGVLCCFVALVASSLMPRLFYLFVTFGLLYGLGSGLILKSMLDLLLNRFPDHCGRVSFLIFTGSTAGNFAWTPITTTFIDLWGWRNCLRVTGGIMLLFCIPCTYLTGVAVKPPRPESSGEAKSPDEAAAGGKKKAGKAKKDKEEIKWEGPRQKRMARMPEAWLFGLANLVPFVSMGFFNVNLVSFATSLSYTSHQGSTLVTVAAAAEAGAKLVFAIFVDKLPFRKVHFMAALSLASALVTLTCAFVPSFPILCVIGVGIGCVRATMNALPFTVGMEIFGLRKSSGSNTLILFAEGLGTITSAFVIGGTYDASGSYSIAIYTCTGCFLLTAVLHLLIALTSKLHKVIGVKVRIDEVTGVAEMVPVVEDQRFMIEEFVTVL